MGRRLGVNGLVRSAERFDDAPVVSVWTAPGDDDLDLQLRAVDPTSFASFFQQTTSGPTAAEALPTVPDAADAAAAAMLDDSPDPLAAHAIVDRPDDDAAMRLPAAASAAAGLGVLDDMAVEGDLAASRHLAAGELPSPASAAPMAVEAASAPAPAAAAAAVDGRAAAWYGPVAAFPSASAAKPRAPRYMPDGAAAALHADAPAYTPTLPREAVRRTVLAVPAGGAAPCAGAAATTPSTISSIGAVPSVAVTPATADSVDTAGAMAVDAQASVADAQAAKDVEASASSSSTSSSSSESASDDDDDDDDDEALAGGAGTRLWRSWKALFSAAGPIPAKALRAAFAAVACAVAGSALPAAAAAVSTGAPAAATVYHGAPAALADEAAVALAAAVLDGPPPLLQKIHLTILRQQVLDPEVAVDGDVAAAVALARRCTQRLADDEAMALALAGRPSAPALGPRARRPALGATTPTVLSASYAYASDVDRGTLYAVIGRYFVAGRTHLTPLRAAIGRAPCVARMQPVWPPTRSSPRSPCGPCSWPCSSWRQCCGTAA